MRRLVLFAVLAALGLGLAGCPTGTEPVRKTNSHFGRLGTPATETAKKR